MSDITLWLQLVAGIGLILVSIYGAVTARQIDRHHNCSRRDDELGRFGPSDDSNTAL